VAVAALRDAAHPRIQIGLGVSDSYVVGKLNTTHGAALEMARPGRPLRSRYVDDVPILLPPMPAAPTWSISTAVLQAVIQAGVTTVKYPGRDWVFSLLPSGAHSSEASGSTCPH